MSKAFEFYKGRIESCPSYGFKSGREMLRVIMRCVVQDRDLTNREFNIIMNLAYEAHIKMMEDNYNEGWS